MAAAPDFIGTTLAEICGDPKIAYAHLLVSDLVLDSRDVRPGAAFVALAGARAHGLDFAAQALRRGAVVVLYDPDDTERDVPRPSVAIPRLRSRLGELARRLYARAAVFPAVTGITGTNGKTTVAWLLAQALTRVGRTAGYIGTLGYGVVPQLAEHRLTTPDCLSLHREIALMPVSQVALEVSSHGLTQNRLDGIDVTGAVFTNLSHDHLDAHGSMEAYAAAKALLFARPEVEHAVINADDAYAGVIKDALHHDARAVSISLADKADADLLGRIEQRGLAGLSISIDGTYGRAELDSRLIGTFNATNLLLALAAMLNLDVPLGEACAALAACSPPPGRMEVFGGGDRPHVIVDYAHTPDALSRALAAVRYLVSGELWCVFGCGGDRDTSKRPAMGAAAGRADHVILTDDNPRSEDPDEIVAAIAAGLGEHRDVVIEHDRGAAISRAVSRARAGDVVLVAGRGHERIQLRRDTQVAFDDRKCVAELLGVVS